MSSSKNVGNTMTTQQFSSFGEEGVCVSACSAHKVSCDCARLGLFSFLISSLKPSEIPQKQPTLIHFKCPASPISLLIPVSLVCFSTQCLPSSLEDSIPERQHPGIAFVFVFSPVRLELELLSFASQVNIKLLYILPLQNVPNNVIFLGNK